MTDRARLDGKTLLIDFVGMLGLPDTAENRDMGTLRTGRRQTFKNALPRMADELNAALGAVDGLAEALARVARAAMDREAAMESPGCYYALPELNPRAGGMDPRAWRSALETALDKAAPWIHGWTEELFSKPRPEDKYPEEGWLPRHDKILIGASRMLRMAVPFAAEYARRTDLRDDQCMRADLGAWALDRMSRFHEREAGGPIHMCNKVFDLLARKIGRTAHIDRMIWQYLPNLGRSVPEWVAESFQKSIGEIVAKLDPDMNPVTFLAAVAWNQTRYLFQSNFPVSYRPLTRVDADNEVLSNHDRENVLVSRGEDSEALERMCVLDAREHMERTNGRRVGADEADWFAARVPVDRFQTSAMMMWYARWTQGSDVLRGTTRMDYYALYAHLLEWMERQGLACLEAAMRSRPMREGEAKVSRPVRQTVLKAADEAAGGRIWAEAAGRYRHTSEKLAHAAPVRRLCVGAYENRRMEVPRWRDAEKGAERPFSAEPSELAQDAARFVKACAG